MVKRFFPLVIASSVLAAIVAVEYFSILSLNSGVFVYTLDDTYIHLSLAENIIRGNYGINPGEFSSPSSGIIWPLILSLFALLPGFMFVPLLLNIAVSLGTLALSWKILNTLFKQNKRSQFIITVLLIYLIPSTGMVGLIFMGMEHSLQVFSIVFVLYVMVKELQGVSKSGMMGTAIFLASVVRYENLAICIFALLFFLVRGRVRETIYAAAGMLIIHSGFMMFLYAHTSAFLPSSVSLKLQSLHGAGYSFSKLFSTIGSPFGALYTTTAAIFLAYFLLSINTYRLLAIGGTFAIIAHLFFGYTQTLGGFSLDLYYFFRYEMYLWTLINLLLMIISAHAIQKHSDWSPVSLMAMLILLEGLFSSRNHASLFTIPNAANNIYEQQYQNHRLVTELYRKPVAVNDIGFVSFHNEQYVLDLWGLASRDTWKLRLSNPLKTHWMDSVASAKGVGLAIIYDVWFPVVPSSWKKVAELSLTKKQVTASENIVSYYSTRSEDYNEVVKTMQDFQQILPNRSMLMLYDTLQTKTSEQATNSIRAHR